MLKKTITVLSAAMYAWAAVGLVICLVVCRARLIPALTDTASAITNFVTMCIDSTAGHILGALAIGAALNYIFNKVVQ